MRFNMYDIAQMIDFSIVRPEVDEIELDGFIKNLLKYRFIGAHVLPYFVKELSDRIGSQPDILIGTGVGFPFGNHKTEIKVHEARLAIEDGCKEVDMVLNISALLSKRYKYVEDDIASVVKEAGSVPVKVIFEVHYLTEELIRNACRLSINGGASFVKTATGHAPSGASPEIISIMKEEVKGFVKIKASGGIRDLVTLTKIYTCGARRFGIGAGSAVNIMTEIEENGGYVDIG